MDSLFSIQTNLEQLNQIFDVFNDRYYNGMLQKPRIQIGALGANQKSRYARDVYESVTGKRYSEMMFNRNILQPDSIDPVVTEMLRLMAIHYGETREMKISCNNDRYFNKRFKEVCKLHGLTCRRSKYGWNIVELTEESKKIISHYEWSFLISGEQYTYGDHDLRGHSIKYVCPTCGSIVRSNKEIRVICADCVQEFVRS